MTDVSAWVMTADPDPAVWVRVPGAFPDGGHATAAQWAAHVAEHYGPAEDRARFALLMEDLAESEQRRADGVALLFLPADLRGMAKARVRITPADMGPGDPPPLVPAADTYDAEHLGPALRAVTATPAAAGSTDALVTVSYTWRLGPADLRLSLATLDPGQAVAMLPELDDLADTIRIEDGAGAPVRAEETP